MPYDRGTAAALGRASAMASHGGHDERPRTSCRRSRPPRGGSRRSLAIPRLPAVMATLWPLCTLRPRSSRASCPRTSPATSATRVSSKVCRTRKICGKLGMAGLFEDRYVSFHDRRGCRPRTGVNFASVVGPAFCAGLGFGAGVVHPLGWMLSPGLSTAYGRLRPFPPYAVMGPAFMPGYSSAGSRYCQSRSRDSCPSGASATAVNRSNRCETVPLAWCSR